MEFQEVAPDDSKGIAQLSVVASEIVKEHYDSIIGLAMNDYMIAMFQSVPAITQQLEEGCQYWFIKDKDIILGFMAACPRENALYLSKFYLYKHQRGKGHARQMLEFLIQVARDNGLKSIELNVNRNNPAVHAYEKLGFVVIREERNDIGKGFVMDDYVFALKV